MPDSLTTARLTLRRWRDSDHIPFQQINADPRVMEFMPTSLTPGKSDDLITRIEQHFQQHGFGLYAADLTETQTFIGYVGLNIPSFEAPFMLATESPRTGPGPWGVIEIGWRLAFDHWGRGLATEGAHAILHHAFETLGLASVVSFTVPQNQRSRRVMEKLGMVHDPSADFDHPRLPEGHALQRHVLYRLNREDQRQSQ